MKKQPLIYNLNDPQYEDIEEKREAEEIAQEEKFERDKDVG